MQVNHRFPLNMRERGNFMHPLPVISIVIGIPLRTNPSAGKQGPLNVDDAILSHHDVDIRKYSCLARWQSRHQISCTFKQHNRRLYAFQSAANTIDLPMHFVALPIG